MTTEHTVVRSGKSKRKPFNSNVADHLLIYRDLYLQLPPLVLSDTSNIGICAFTVLYPERVSMPLRFSWRRLFALLETLVDRYPLQSKARTSFFPSQPSIAAFTSRA
jgi:hypothetical protein